MARSTPRGNTADSREILMSVTGRTSREAVHDSGLIEREGPAHVGCDSSCADGAPCSCSHSMAWRAPRQPRRPAPRTPHLPLWTRFTLWAQSRMAAYWDWRDLMAVFGVLSAIGALMAVVAALVLLR